MSTWATLLGGASGGLRERSGGGGGDTTREVCLLSLGFLFLFVCALPPPPVVLFLFCLFVFKDGVSLCSSGYSEIILRPAWPRTQRPSVVLGLKARAITSGC